MNTHNQHQPTSRRNGAFSLIEMLVVIAVIGVIAAIGTGSVSNVNDSAKTARDQRNAQNVCAMFNSAKVSGVAFASATKEGILEELIGGKTSPTNGMDFKFSQLDDSAKTAMLTYCEYDADQEMMKYSVAGGITATAAAATPDPDPIPDPDPPAPSEWINFEYLENGNLASRISDLQNTWPEREWRFFYTGAPQSWIQFRFP